MMIPNATISPNPATSATKNARAATNNPVKAYSIHASAKMRAGPVEGNRS